MSTAERPLAFRALPAFLLGALLAATLASCAPASPPEAARTQFVLGTVCSVRIVSSAPGTDTSRTLDACFARLQAIEDAMSVNKAGTQLDAVNEAAGKAAVKVGEDLFRVVSKALEYGSLSGGAFDPTVGPLVKLWGIGTEAARVPSRKEIAAALALIDWKGVAIDPAASTVRLARPGMRLDLGAIAKGYAADEMERILLERAVRAAVVDLGGNVFVFGKKPDGRKWRVGVQDPVTKRGEYLGLVEGEDMTVVTSGVYERVFEQDGRRYHHILDTKTGYPVDNGLVSVTIVASSSIDADGLSTSLFALGRERGMALAATLPGVQVIMVDAQDRVYLSPGAGKVFSLTSPNYRLSD